MKEVKHSVICPNLFRLEAEAFQKVLTVVQLDNQIWFSISSSHYLRGRQNREIGLDNGINEPFLQSSRWNRILSNSVYPPTKPPWGWNVMDVWRILQTIDWFFFAVLRLFKNQLWRPLFDGLYSDSRNSNNGARFWVALSPQWELVASQDWFWCFLCHTTHFAWSLARLCKWHDYRTVLCFDRA